MRHRARVDIIRIESGEQGFVLHIATEDGDEFQFVLNRKVAQILAFQETLPIRLWWDEDLVRKQQMVITGTEPQEKSDHWPAWRIDEDRIRDMLEDDLQK